MGLHVQGPIREGIRKFEGRTEGLDRWRGNSGVMCQEPRKRWNSEF